MDEISHIGFLTEIVGNKKVFFVCDESVSPEVEKKVKQVLEQDDDIVDYLKQLEGLQTNF